MRGGIEATTVRVVKVFSRESARIRARFATSGNSRM
jgi:hypothetical protein